MNKYKSILIIGLLVSSASLVAAQTNSIESINASVSLTNTPSSGKESGGIELTLGGAGITDPKTGNTEFGFDFSISTNPFETRPEVWLGISQSVAWEPSFAGSTDVFADWSTDIWNDTLYLNTGWSAGVVYDVNSEPIWRTGPEVYLQYYTSDNAFIYGGLNYDISTEEDGLRYSFGIGLSF